jgi:signal transduction histidine kinase
MDDKDPSPKTPDLFMFLASAAHDMKNSVGMLSGTLEVLLNDEAVKANPVFPQLSHMLYETGRLNNNLIQLLALYKEVGSPSYPFDPQSIDLAEFGADIEAQNRILLESKKIEFAVDVAEDLIWIFDEDIVLGVIGHAINNAVNYTKDKIRLAIFENDGMLEMRVEDNGRGYPPSMIEAGTAVNRGVNFLTGSTGLGLHFSAEVAKMHRHRGRTGNVALENGGAYEGGCFVLRLP